MSIVDTWNLRFEVQAEYPYSTHVCDTEDQVRKVLDFEREVHGVACTVRAIGEARRFYGAPKRNDAEAE